MLNYDLTRNAGRMGFWECHHAIPRLARKADGDSRNSQNQVLQHSKSREFSNVRHWGSFTIMDQHLGSLSLYSTFNFSIHEWPRRESGSIKLLK